MLGNRLHIEHISLALAFFWGGAIQIELSAEEIVINEIMPNHVDVIYDDDYCFPASWVELHNVSDHDIDIQNWYLTNSTRQLKMWRVPNSCVIPSNGYKIIYLDKGDYVFDDNFHANFDLDHTSGHLSLVYEDGETVVDRCKYNDAPINLSYGRCFSDTTTWIWFQHSTPLASNDADCSNKSLAPKVEFDLSAGIYKAPVTVGITAPAQYEKSIYYTLDGSEPTENSDKYTAPLKIDSSTVVRAKIIDDDVLSIPSQVNSYIISSREMSMPILSLSTDPRYLWDDTMGIYVEGCSASNAGLTANYATNRRRPFTMEYFVDGKEVINQLCEARISGGFTRSYEIKSLKLFAKKRYGKKHFKYQFFPEKLSRDKDGYGSILLRNGGNDYQLTLLKDAYCQYWSGGKVDIDYQACKSVIVFLNGEYWGIENIRENDNEDYMASNYGVSDVDLYENYILKEGTPDEFDRLLNLISTPSFDYEQLCSMVDVNELLNYLSLESFAGNYDWPNNNHVFWRDRNGGKWRWLLKDLDGAFTYWPPSQDEDIRWVNFNPFNFLSRTDPYFAYGNAAWATEMFEAILSNPTVKRQYIERMAIQLGDIFHKDQLYHVVDSLNSFIEDEITFHKARWNHPQTTWNSCKLQMPAWIERRNEIVYKMLSDYYSLGEEIPLTITSSEESDMRVEHLSLCGESLYRNQFEGKWFQNDSFTVKAAPKVNGLPFLKWSVRVIDSDNSESELDYFENPLVVRTANNLSYEMTAIYRESIGVEDVKMDGICSFYPNPVRDELTITCLGSKSVSWVQIYDVLGNLVMEKNCGDSECSIKINMASLQNGAYYARVVNERSNEASMFKVIKE